MTRILDNTGFQFTQKAGSTQANEPGVVTMPDGSKRRITLEIQVNGVWKKIDTSKFVNKNGQSTEQRCLNTIAKKCQEIYQRTTGDKAGQPETLTVYFEQKNLPKSFKSAILGKFFKRFKQEVVDLTFKKMEYKTAGSTELQVFDVETHEFNDDEAAKAVNELASSLTVVSKPIFANREGYIEQPKKIKLKKPQSEAQTKPQSEPKSEAERNSENLTAIKRILNVEEAGSRENRCATLSIAAILLKRNNGDLQKAADQFKIPLVLPIQDGETPQITLSNGLIELAARTIETNDLFTAPDTADNLNSHFSSVVAALGNAIADGTTREAVVKQYAALIRQPGQLLDTPVFEALAMHGIPIITLVPSQGDLVLGSVSDTIIFDAEQRSLGTYDLTTICFVVRDGLHYQPVMMDDTTNVDQQVKLRSILKNDMDKTLGQIQNLITDSRPSAEKSVEFNKLVGSVVNKYPIDAKPRIIQMLRNARRTFDYDLIPTPNLVFVAGATYAFLSNPGPIIEEVD